MAKNFLKKHSHLFSWHLLVFSVIFAVAGGYLVYRTFAVPNPLLTGDINNDNVVNVADLSILLSYYGQSNTEADLDFDNYTNITDLSILLSNYGEVYTPPDPIDTAFVSITSSGFLPATISINAGDQIVWINDDSAPHQVAADPHPSHNSITDFDSEIVLQPGDSFGFIFENPGTYGLHDETDPTNASYFTTVIVE